MSDSSHVDNSDGIKMDDVLDGPKVDADESVRPQNSFSAAFVKFFGKSQPGRAAGKRDLKQDRTRSLLLLIGGIVGAVVLFVAVLSTPPTPFVRDRAPARPNLGLREAAGTTQIRSVTPILNARARQDEYAQGRLNAQDITNTARRDTAERDREQELDLARGQASLNSRVIEGGIVYRGGTTMRKNVSGLPAGAERERTEPHSFYSTTFSPPNLQTTLPQTTAATPKSSLVFIRASVAPTGEPIPSSVGSLNASNRTLLPPGSRLIARLESAITSALKAPVVAAIEYNYERNHMIVIPAGAKAIGELQQASTSGYVAIGFHTLQMPDGRTEKIEAVAMDLQNEPLKGKVTGMNRGRNFTARTLSGVGTIAAYAVGGGSTLGQPITGATLLRERLASNIGSAGEQELTNAAFSQNIVVTVPAQTRLYIIFQKAAVEPVANSSGPSAIRSGVTELPTAQELRELLDLKREINRMYETSSATNPAKP